MPAQRLLSKLGPRDLQSFGQVCKDLRGLVQEAGPDVWSSVLERTHPKAELLLPAAPQQDAIAQLAGLHKDLKTGSHLVRYVSCCGALNATQRLILRANQLVAAKRFARHPQV